MSENKNEPGKEIKNVWLYARRRSSLNQLNLQRAMLYQMALDHNFNVVGFSSDEADDYLFYRPGLRQAAKAVKKKQVDAVLVVRLTNISHSCRRLLWFLKKLQNSGGILMTASTDLRYELHERGLEQPLLHRARKKKLVVPW